MAAATDLAQYSRRRVETLRLWGGAIVFSVVLNLSLFGFMPDLVRRVPGGRINTETLQPVRIVRLNPPDPPPKKEAQPEPRKPVETKPSSTVATSVLRPRHIHPEPFKFDFKPELSPELNPDLSRASTEIPMLPIQSVAFEAEALPEVAPVPAPPRKVFYGIDELDGPLVPLSQIPPGYPLRAKRKGIEGRVKVKFLVTGRGTVEQARILSAVPADLFEKNVLKAVSAWRFKPGRVDGKPVKTWVSTVLEFKLH